MKNIFSGRPVLAGQTSGEAVVSKTGFNAYAVFYNSLEEGTKEALAADSGNPEIYGKRLDGRILCIPNSIGSTSAGAVWSRIVNLGVAPLAVLFSEAIDPLAAGGLVVADMWSGSHFVVVDQLGEAFLEQVTTGSSLHIFEDGRVIIR
ncbi:MAG: DUF126 domain-containing protein [Chloroflexi bacterium]|nr:DUF126 domain-containing protein [Chloroflexota bacterium]